MPDDQSRCDESVTAINAVAQDMSTGKPTLRCLMRHSNPEPRWQAWVTNGNAHSEQDRSGSLRKPDFGRGGQFPSSLACLSAIARRACSFSQRASAALAAQDMDCAPSVCQCSRGARLSSDAVCPGGKSNHVLTPAEDASHAATMRRLCFDPNRKCARPEPA
jgi:hypothetical protein